MMKQHKGKLMVSSVLTLLPSLVGLLLWNRLPNQMPTHWGGDGTADGWSGKAFAVFGMPLILLAVHWLCVWGTSLDSSNRGQNRKVSGLVLWIIPVLSWFTSGIMYAGSMGWELDFVKITLLLMGALFVVIGNYLPKCKQNHTIGIRVKWTLEDEENWNATHRVGGRIWVAGGAALLAGCALPEKVAIALMLAVIPVLVAVPVLYSYRFYQKKVREGRPVVASETMKLLGKRGKILSLAAVAVILVLVAGIMFTGNLEYRYDEDAFTVEADYYQDLTVEYAAVDHIEYRETDKAGVRTFGFGSARLMMGQFKNDEFGVYTRYSYTKCDSCVVLTAGEDTLVLSGPNEAATRAIYEELTARQ